MTEPTLPAESADPGAGSGSPARPAVTSSPVTHLVVMGVAGCGKTTVAGHLSRALGWPAAEADDFHPPASIEKMAAGTPLTDADRWPWLASLRDWMSRQAAQGASTVVTCSALRRSYRDLLAQARGRVRFVHLDVPEAELVRRMEQREGHFMPASLLPSQLATLEALEDDEDGVVVTARESAELTAVAALEALGAGPGASGLPGLETGSPVPVPGRREPEAGRHDDGGDDEGVLAEGVPAEGVPAEGVPAEGVLAEGVLAEGVPAEGVPAGEGAPAEAR